MSNLAALTAQRDGLLKKIREIEAPGNGVEKILEAIKNQRWYFIKNKPKILFDRNTGLIWANLHTFNYLDKDGYNYNLDNVDDIINNYSFGFGGFRVPAHDELWQAVADKTIPFHTGSSNNWRLFNCRYCDCKYKGKTCIKYLDGDKEDIFDLEKYGIRAGASFSSDIIGGSTALFPCSDYLIQNSDYQEIINPDNPVYTEKERLQFTLDLFTKNELWPIFDDAEVTELYKQIYFEKPKLLAQLQELQTQINELQTVTLLSSEFDYTALLAKYDIKAIDASLIKYYQAVQQWCRELIEKVDYYEEQKGSVIKDFNLISLKLSKKYEANPNLTEAENILLRDRQHFFQKNFSLGMNSVKTKILAVKKQADALEYRIDEIDEGENSLRELAELEQEKRASFAFLAENTAKIIKNALRKIEYFEANHTFVMNAINIWENWTEGYRVFKTTYKEDMKNDCEDDGIEEEIWSAWYQDWQQLRYAIELKCSLLLNVACMVPCQRIKKSRHLSLNSLFIF